MNIEDKLKDILDWLNKHGLEEEAERLAELIECASCGSKLPDTKPDNSSNSNE